MTTPPVLRMRRPLHQLCWTLMPASDGKAPTLSGGIAFASSTLLVMSLFVVALVVLVNKFAPSTPDGLLYALLICGGAVFLASPLLYRRGLVVSRRWSEGGAGQPVLAIGDGEVLGRLRPAWRDWMAVSRPDRDDWWDLRVPVAAIRGVRVDRAGPGAPVLVLDVPEDLASALLTNAATQAVAEKWRDRVGSPVAWPVGRLAGPWRRAKRLNSVLSGLSAAGVIAAVDDRV